MPIYVFACRQGHRSERVVPVGTETMACLLCDEQDCGRVYGYSVAITQPEVDTRGMTRRFIEASEELHHNAQRVEAATGQPVVIPDLRRLGQAKAEARRRAGEGAWRRQW